MVKNKYSREVGEVQVAGRQVMGGYSGRAGLCMRHTYVVK